MHDLIDCTTACRIDATGFKVFVELHSPDTSFPLKKILTLRLVRSRGNCERTNLSLAYCQLKMHFVR